MCNYDMDSRESLNERNEGRIGRWGPEQSEGPT